MKSIVGYFLLWTKKNATLLYALVAIHLVFFLLALRNGNIIFSVDSTEYLYQAGNIKEHASWYAGDFQKPHQDFLETRRPPLYGFFIFLIHLISTNNYFLLALQNILSILSLLISAFVFWQLTGKRFKSSLILLLPLFFFPAQFIYANMIMADTLFQFLLVCALMFFVHSIKKPSSFLWFSVFVAMAILCKPVLYMFSLVVPVLALLLYSKKIYNLSTIFYSLIPLLVVIGISTANYSRTGYFHYSSVNEKFISEYGAYLAVGNRGDTAAQQQIDSIIFMAKQQPDFNSYCKYLNQESIQLIKENKARFVMMQLKGMANLFLDHGRFDLMAFFVHPDYMQTAGWKYYYQQNGIKGIWQYVSTFNSWLLLYLFLAIVVNIFLFVLTIRFLFSWQISMPVRIMLLLLIVYLTLFTGVVGCSRYRMAFFPVIWMAFMWWYSSVKGRTHQELGTTANDKVV